MIDATQAEIDRGKLIKERQALEDFLASDGFYSAKLVVDEEIQEGLSSIIDLPVVDIATLVTHFQVIGEVKANQQFEKRFRVRLAELNELIGPEEVEN